MSKPPEAYSIFLSHSSKQKPFVEELNRDLRRAGHSTFFDSSPDSLRISEPVQARIKEEASACALGVVVLSEEFLTSMWPMLELCYLCDSKRRLCPLFYRLSFEDCKLEKNRLRWRKKWADLAARGNTIDPQKCLQSLENLLELKGEGFRQGSELEYRSKIVSQICNILPPPAQSVDSHVQGKDRIREEIFKMFNHAEPTASGARLITLHGEGGSGKTTVCRIMVDAYRAEYVGKAFLLELPLDGDGTKIFGECKKAATILTEASADFFNTCTELSQVISLLMRRLTDYKVFLVIDNVSERCKKVATDILSASFHRETKVVVTSRSRVLLHDLLKQHRFDNEKSCHHAVPSMDRNDAIAALLYYANGNNIAENWLGRVVELAGFDNRWNPLMVEALGRRLGKINVEKDLDDYLSDLITRPYGSKEGLDVLAVLKKSFDEINDEGRKLLFLDAALVLPHLESSFQRSFDDVCRLLSKIHFEKTYFEISEDHGSSNTTDS